MFNTNTPIGYQEGSYLSSPSIKYKTPTSNYYTPRTNEKEIKEEIKIEKEIEKLESKINELEIKNIIEKKEETEIFEEIEKEEENENIKDYFLTKGCNNIFKHISNITILDKSSASNSIIMFGVLNYESKKKEYEINDKKIGLKISYEEKDPLNNSLLVEEQIYNNIISNLIIDHTPHVINHIASIKDCNLSYKKTDFTQDQLRFIKDKLEEFKYDYDINKTNVVVLEKTNGDSFLKNMELLSPNDQLIVIFQVLYTIMCFNNITLRHNDLHNSNIFLEKITPTTYHYDINGLIISMKPNWIVKIYDFDRSAVYHPSVSRNFYIDTTYCYEYRQCQSLNEKIDLQSFISGLFAIKSILSPVIKTWITEITSPKFREKLSKRRFIQISETDFIDDADILPISSCMKKLLTSMKSLYIENKDEKKEEKIYKLPQVYKIGKHFPISTNTYVYKHIDEFSFEHSKMIVIINNILNNIYLLLDKVELFVVYYNEFLKLNYDIKKKAKELFDHLYKLKQMKKIRIYLETCILLSLPFWYKITNNKIKLNLSNMLFSSYYPEAEYNIWNLFNNKLPIEMPLV